MIKEERIEQLENDVTEIKDAVNKYFDFLTGDSGEDLNIKEDLKVAKTLKDKLFLCFRISMWA
jgi:hypothetical protein